MKIGGLQKTTLVDYPGYVAATIFTQGCNFRCAYCHNPELVIPSQFEKVIDQDFVLDFLRQRRGQLDAVCITGGEPTMHADLADFIRQIKAMDYLVKLDSNGSSPHQLGEVLQTGLVDYVAMDIKGPIARYQTISNAKTAVPIADLILDSIKLIMSSGVDYEFRTTVAKPLLKPSDFANIGLMIEGAKRYFLQNYVRSKQVDANATFRPFTNDELNQAITNIQPFVQYVSIR